MRVSKNPVLFANRAEMVDTDGFSVGAHIPERLVCLNVYVSEETRVLSMTPEEAEFLAYRLLNGAAETRQKAQDARHAARQDARVWQDVEPAQTAKTRGMLARQAF